MNLNLILLIALGYIVLFFAVFFPKTKIDLYGKNVFLQCTVLGLVMAMIVSGITYYMFPTTGNTVFVWLNATTTFLSFTLTGLYRVKKIGAL